MRLRTEKSVTSYATKFIVVFHHVSQLTVAERLPFAQLVRLLLIHQHGDQTGAAFGRVLDDYS